MEIYKKIYGKIQNKKIVFNFKQTLLNYFPNYSIIK